MAMVATLPAPSPLRVLRVESQPFGEHTYVVSTTAGRACLVIDPGFEPGAVMAELDRGGLEPAAILLTHGHADHIAGTAALRGRWPDLPILIGRGDAAKLTDPAGNLSAAFGLPLTSPPATRLLATDDRLEIAGLVMRVAEIPGHSPGHVVYIVETCVPPVVLGGDVLFRDGVGRSDFPDGDAAALAAGIRARLYTLPSDTIVFPGHGEPTTIGRERRSNPFVRGSAAEA